MSGPTETVSSMEHRNLFFKAVFPHELHSVSQAPDWLFRTTAIDNKWAQFGNMRSPNTLTYRFYNSSISDCLVSYASWIVLNLKPIIRNPVILKIFQDPIIYLMSSPWCSPSRCGSAYVVQLWNVCILWESFQVPSSRDIWEIKAPPVYWKYRKETGKWKELLIFIELWSGCQQETVFRCGWYLFNMSSWISKANSSHLSGNYIFKQPKYNTSLWLARHIYVSYKEKETTMFSRK